MPASVSPGCTTYRTAGRAAGPGAAAAPGVLVRVTSALLAVLVPAWAGRTGPVMPAAAAMISRMLQASQEAGQGGCPRPASAGTSFSIGQLAGTPSWPASSPYGTSGTTRRATRKISLGSAPGGRST